MTDQDKKKQIEAALQESAKVEQTLIMAAPILMDIRGVGSFSLPIPGTNPVKYVAAGTLAEIERATRGQDALQQIADFGQEQNAAPKLFPSALLKLYAFTEDGMEIDNAHGHWYKKDDVERLLASLSPVAAEPVRQAPVAWMDPTAGCVMDAFLWQQDAANPQYSTPVYTALQVLTAAELRAAALEEAADVLEAMNDSSGDAAAYDNREMNTSELEREYAISDCVKKLRALAAAPSVEVKSEQGEMGGKHA